MTKKRSRCLFIVFTILLVIGLIATFVNFTYPLGIKGKYYSYSNFVSNLKLGEDIGTSLRLTYRADLPENELKENYDKLYDETINDLKEIFQSQGYKDVTVAASDNNRIVIQVGNIVDENDENEIVSLIGDMSQIYFSMSSSTDSAFATANDVSKIEVLNQATDKTYYYVRVNFKSSSLDKIKDATKEGGTLYMLMGDTTIGTMDIESSSLTSGYLDIYSEDFVDQASATSYANKLRTGTFALQLVELENARISSSYGIGANIYLAIGMFIVILTCFGFLIYKYKHLGLVASYSMMFFLVISLFLLQSIPAVHLNFAGIIGFMVAFVVAIDSIITIYERAKSHYQSDVKLYIAMKQAQKETMAKTIISNVLLTFVGLVCLFMPSMQVHSFGWVVFVMSIVSIFNTLALMRLFIKMYLPFNNNNGKKCNFNKGGKDA